jgi:hypothetical protein
MLAMNNKNNDMSLVLWWKKLEKYSDRVYDYFRSIIISVVVAR